MKLPRIFGLVVCLTAAAFGQRLDPAQWTLSSDVAVAKPGAIIPLRLSATLEPGWHLYSLTIPSNLIPTTIKIENPAVESYTVYQPKPEIKFDPNLNFDAETYEKEAVFWVPATLKQDAPGGPLELTTAVHYRTCNDKICLPPKTKSPSFKMTVAAFAPDSAAFPAPAGYIEVKPGTTVRSSVQTSPPATQSSTQPSGAGLGAFALTAFGFGLAAIFTPCVFPMIPITVSFFMNQRGGFVQALVFSLGIIVLFSGLGLVAGPFVGLIGANPWVNAFIAGVFGLFALSLLGAFEITLPSGMLTKLDSASRRGGYLGTLLMGLTFSLTSFACVGPFMGPLLVSSVQGGQGAQPVIGMASFATGLASPFFLLAAFPSYLKKLPKSGGWLVRVKVVMGFVLLALMFKYLSNIDQVLQTNLLTRERFLAAWFVLFTMPGLYLLGFLRLEGIEANERVGTARLLLGCGFLILALSLVPGMFGAPLGELDAYVPAPSASIGGSSQAGLVWMKDQYREALDRGKQENKLVLVTFTGYACTNCHWMKANMFPRPEIFAEAQNMVLVELYTDGGYRVSEENAALEDSKFQTAAQPFYALMDGDENVVATFDRSTRDAAEFLAFLKKRPA
jgi:thiol:disulfide interchange protein